MYVTPAIAICEITFIYIILT